MFIMSVTHLKSVYVFKRTVYYITNKKNTGTNDNSRGELRECREEIMNSLF